VVVTYTYNLSWQLTLLELLEAYLHSDKTIYERKLHLFLWDICYFCVRKMKGMGFFGFLIKVWLFMWLPWELTR
jgi:hypothetical protein